MEQYWNILIEFLAQQEPVAGTYDLAILAGNSLPYLADHVAKRYLAGEIKQIFLVGGIGHATVHLRNNFAVLGYQFGNVSETEMYLTYLQKKYQIPTEVFILEMNSTHSGENAAFALKVLQKQATIPKEILLVEDPLLQRRIKATFEKHWQGIATTFTNDVPLIPYVKELNQEVSFLDESLNHLWPRDYFISLVLGEIPRLRNDAQGYGPKGKDFIVPVAIPTEVEAAYARLTEKFDYQAVR